MQKKKKLALNSGIQTNQILTKNDEFCIPRLLLIKSPYFDDWFVIYALFLYKDSCYYYIESTDN